MYIHKIFKNTLSPKIVKPNIAINSVVAKKLYLIVYVHYTRNSSAQQLIKQLFSMIKHIPTTALANFDLFWTKVNEQI